MSYETFAHFNNCLLTIERLSFFYNISANNLILAAFESQIIFKITIKFIYI